MILLALLACNLTEATPVYIPVVEGWSLNHPVLITLHGWGQVQTAILPVV